MSGSLPRGENHVVVLGAVSSEDPAAVLPIRINPATGYVIMGVYDRSVGTPATVTDSLVKDENHVPVMPLIDPATGDFISAMANEEGFLLIENTP